MDVAAKHHAVGNGGDKVGTGWASREGCRDSCWHNHVACRPRAGCLRTRRSTTGIAAYHGKRVIKAASTTQTVIALSSGESEFDAVELGPDGQKIPDIVENMGYHCTEGRSQSAFEAARDGLSRVGIGQADLEIRSELRKSRVGHEWNAKEKAAEVYAVECQRCSRGRAGD